MRITSRLFRSNIRIGILPSVLRPCHKAVSPLMRLHLPSAMAIPRNSLFCRNEDTDMKIRWFLFIRPITLFYPNHPLLQTGVTFSIPISAPAGCTSPSLSLPWSQLLPRLAIFQVQQHTGHRPWQSLTIFILYDPISISVLTNRITALPSPRQ